MPHASAPQSDDHAPSFFVPNPLPVFPLPNVVFFPNTYLPLHVFEPRYREMIADAAAGGHCVGMALLKEGWEDNYYGNPPIFEVGCVGRLVSTQGLPDGRSNIVLEGLHRYEIREQFYTKSYRRARVVLKPHAAETSLDPAVRADLIHVLTTFLGSRETGHVWAGFLDAGVKDDVLIHSLSTYLEFTPLDKQLLLEADTLVQRARRLSDLIQFKVYERDGMKGRG
jgi:uncharacterized protein